MPRDDLSIAAHFPNMPPEHLNSLDPLTVLEEFVSRSANLPAELRYMREEIDDKNRQLQIVQDGINHRDASIQKFIKLNGSQTPNPKAAKQVQETKDLYDRAQVLQEANCALALKTQQTVERQIRALDKQLKFLQDRGEFPDDPDLPSLLRPAQEQNRPMTPAALAAQAAASNRMTAQQAAAQRISGLSLQTSNLPHSVSAPTTPAAPLMLQRHQRESSANASNKRQRLGTGAGTLPQTSSNLARHASTGPGTPKAGMGGAQGTPSRSGSVGPRGGSQKGGNASGKKVAPHKITLTNTATKSKLGKSGLSRVKNGRSSGTKVSSTASTNSELSDAASNSDDEHMSPGPKKEDEEMEDDEGSDDRKYCMCQKVSYGDMVACDNPDCEFEWFHWPCVGLTKEPVGVWICPPCMEKNKQKAERERDRGRR